MSKGNMLLGQARGKVGSLVFSRANGAQIVRSRAEVVKNPQTRAQTIQRIIMTTVAQAYSLMSPICDHSFEGISKGQKSMSEFMKRNLEMLRSQLSSASSFDAKPPVFSPIGSGVAVPNSYIISKGTLPKPNVKLVDTAFHFGAPQNTYASVIEWLGVQRGDQLTLCWIYESSSGDVGFNYARIILDPVNADGSKAELSVPFLTTVGDDMAINLPNPRNLTDSIYSYYFNAEGATDEKFTIMPVQEPMAANAVILSRKRDDGVWLRSSASLKTHQGFAENFDTMNSALAKFYAGGIDIESSVYLNNATGV